LTVPTNFHLFEFDSIWFHLIQFDLI